MHREMLQMPLLSKQMYILLYTTLFKVSHHPLQSTTQPFSKYHTTLFKVPHNPLQSTTQPSSKYHTTLFKCLYYLNKCILLFFVLLRDSSHYYLGGWGGIFSKTRCFHKVDKTRCLIYLHKNFTIKVPDRF